MKQTFTLKEKTKQILILLIPILITQLSMFSMVFFNTMMSGRYDSADLAGVAIGASIWNPVFIGLSGILLAVSPIAAQKIGEKNNSEVTAIVKNGLVLSVLIALIVIIAGILLLNPLLSIMGIEGRVYEIAFHYLSGLSIGIFPLFAFNVLRSFIYALGKTRIVMVILLLAIPINLVMNYILIFGKFGFPELGGAGGGYATAITYWFILFMTILVILKLQPYSTYKIFARSKGIEWSKIGEILKIGIPMGLSAFFETSMFACVTILLSRFDVTTIAAYQSALNIVSFLYMIPISISIALTVVVGYEVGAGRNKDAKTYSWLGIYMAMFIALLTGLLIVFFRYEVASLYSSEPAVVALTSHFLIFALFFQISDAMQVTAQAALRGYKDVNIAFIITLVAYWLICLPVGFVLANYTSLGATGYWLGLTAGLLVAGIFLSGRLLHIQKHKFSYASSTAN